MKMLKKLALGVAAGCVAATAVLAASHEGNPAVKARKAQMALHAYNVGILAGMAQGKSEYDSAMAASAAANLAALAGTDWHAYFPPGTAAGEVEGTKALPAIWTDMAGFEAKQKDLATAATALAGAAGTDLAALQGAMGPVGAACGACHQAYRQ